MHNIYNKNNQQSKIQRSTEMKSAMSANHNILLSVIGIYTFWKNNTSIWIIVTSKLDLNTRSILPGHGLSLHVETSVSLPLQYSPPCCGTGSVHVLFLNWRPPPHVESQSFHEVHELHIPSTEMYVVYMILLVKLYEIKVCVLLSTVVELICTIRILHSCDKTKSKHTTPSEQSQIYYENRRNRARSRLL